MPDKTCLIILKVTSSANPWYLLRYSKTYVKQPLSKRPKIGFEEHLSIRPLFCVFLSGHFTQVLLYKVKWDTLAISMRLISGTHHNPLSHQKIPGTF